MPNAFDTREGDVLVRDLGTDFYVWVITRVDRLRPDRYVYPFVTARRAVALEHAFKLAGGTGGRVFLIGRGRTLSEVRRLTKRHQADPARRT
jgi:hypothetical protein